jgi:hypothetical protein
MWRSNAVMYVTAPYKKVSFPILIFFYQPIGAWFWNSPRISIVNPTRCTISQVLWLLASKQQQNLYDIYLMMYYRLKLLMMGGQTARNM